MHYLLPVLPAVVVVQSESVRRSVVLLSPACCSTSPVTVVSPDPLHCLPPVSAQYVSLQWPPKIAATKVAHAKVCRHAPYAPYHAKQALCIVSSLSPPSLSPPPPFPPSCATYTLWRVSTRSGCPGDSNQSVDRNARGAYAGIEMKMQPVA